MKSITSTLCAVAASALISVSAWALEAQPEAEAAPGGGRIAAIGIEAEVLEINHETREMNIRGPMGDIVSVTASEEIERLDEIEAGDIIALTYVTSLGGELREPTEAELAEPWVELDAAAIAGDEIAPGAAIGMAVRAVCTIEGLNRVTGTVTVLDPRGKYHVIGDVDPAKMEGVTLGSTLVLTYTQALAIAIEEKPAEAPAAE